MSEGFPMFQMHVANRLGVSEERVRELRPRALEEGVDWVKRGSRNLYALSAVEKLQAALALPALPEMPLKLEDEPALLGWPEVHRIQVLKIWQNPSYVGGIIALDNPRPNAAANEAGFAPIPAHSETMTLLRVRVKTSANLVRGMVIPCVYVEGSSDLYQAVKLPSRKGRW